MKKMVIAALATMTLTATMWSCGRIGGNMTEVNVTTNPVAYRQFTSDNDVVEGNLTAKQTISALVGKEVVIGEDYPKGSSLGVIPVEDPQTGERYTCYQVDNYGQDKETQFLFLYNDDTKAVLAEKSSFEYLKDGDRKTELDFEFKEKAIDGVFAYDCGNPVAIFSEDKTTTSVWAFNPTNSEVNLIWCEIESPVWAHYFD